MNGPYDSEQQARADAHQAVRPEPGWSILRAAGNRELLRRALGAAGVGTGAYDDRIAGWLAGFEDAICQVVASWVSRANRVPQLGDADRAVIARARGLAAAGTDLQLRDWIRSQGRPLPPGAGGGYLYGDALTPAQELLGGLLAILDRGQHAPAAPGADPILIDAVADAIDYRSQYLDGFCADCSRLDDEHDGPGPAPLCGDHQADADAAAAYGRLLATLRPAPDASDGGQR